MTIAELTKSALARLDDIYEFRAFSALSYKIFGDVVSKGYKVTAIIPHTDQQADQGSILQKLSAYDNKYLLELTLQHSVSIFEAWLFDLLRVLLGDPNRLNKKRKVDVSDVIASKNLEELKSAVIDAELNEIRYKRPAEWFEYLGGFVNIGAPSAYDIERIAEIKATRDILVHNDGIANQVYVSKSGGCARIGVGEPCGVTADYLNESWKHLRQVIEHVGKLVSAKIDATTYKTPGAQGREHGL